MCWPTNLGSEDTMTLSETIQRLESELEMTDSNRVERTGRSVAHLRD